MSVDRWIIAKEKKKPIPEGGKASILITSSMVEFESMVRGFLEDVEDIYSINVSHTPPKKDDCVYIFVLLLYMKSAICPHCLIYYDFV